MEFSSIVSVIALLLSLLSAWYTRHAARAARAQANAAKQQAAAAKAQLSLDQDRRNEELARRRKEDEKAARADLRVTLISVRPHPQIVLHNHGPHLATEISLTYLDADDGLAPPDTSRWHELATTLGPERASSVDADFGIDTTRRFRVTLSWKDGTGSRSTVEQLQLH